MELNRSFNLYRINTSNNDYHSDYYTEYSMSIAQKMSFYLFIVIAIVGFVGNSLSFCVMLRRQMRKTSTSVYLLVLAIFDNLVLFDGIVLHILLPSPLSLQYFLSAENTAICLFITFLEYLAPHVSVWCLVLVTTERLLVIYFPHK